MGQDQSVTSRLNCKIGQKDPHDTEYQTSKPNAHLEYYQTSHSQHKKPIYSIFQKYQQNTHSNSQNTNFPTFQHQNIVKVSDTPFQNSEYIKQMRVYQESGLISLTQIIQNRISQIGTASSVSAFTKEQAKGLLESLVYALAYLSLQQQINPKTCVNHHNFYPTVIFHSQNYSKQHLNNQYENSKICIFKIANPSSSTPSSYFLTSTRKRFSFLSPQLILAIVDQKSQDQLMYEDRTNGSKIMQKSDVFAIGMILLEFCSLKPSAQCYDQENYNILDAVIRQRLQNIRNIYNENQNNSNSQHFGDILSQFISIMLQYELAKRVDAQSLALLVWKKFNALEKQPINRLHQPLQQIRRVPLPMQQNIRGFPIRDIPLQQKRPLQQMQYLPPLSNLPVYPQQQSLVSPQFIQNRDQIPKFKIIQKIAMTPNGPIVISQEMVPNSTNQNDVLNSNIAGNVQANNSYQVYMQHPQKIQQRYTVPYQAIQTPMHNHYNFASAKSKNQSKNAPNPFQQIPQSDVRNQNLKQLQSKYAVSRHLNTNQQNNPVQKTTQKNDNQDIDKNMKIQSFPNKYTTHYTGSNFTLGGNPDSLTSLGGYQKFGSKNRMQPQLNSQTNSNAFQHHYSLSGNSNKESLEQRVQRILNISKNIK